MIDVKKNTAMILEELTINLEKVDGAQLNEFVELIPKAKKIFVAGAGRSGLAIRGFANRMMHLGFNVSVVGDITTTSAHEGDLLIIGSGSGETQSLVAMAEKAKKNGVKVALNTINSESTIGQLADVTFVLPGASPKVEDEELVGKSVQPMGSSYEQLSFLIYDAMIMTLMDLVDETTDTMFPRHANLE
ncbi:6-phospho-3-hexuloisomerase [Candidatus Enterococcus ferrettii]|uniref:6-phospho 3-hexuloisomerase n=1 Tax=Candidatus Enterococcus ferrettii TaxID=2815324 RepID=A0ABV0ESQ2_9ENTE|nr:6-phospho-3-hexuloisomerase [Enterococcus sp. 665A]MBO1342340.1 6-phospho-3-hexuloisomerase [Enterococcus sp. 665A]